MDLELVGSIYDEEIVPIWSLPFARILMGELSSPLYGSTLELCAGTGYLANHLVSYLGPKGRIIALEPHQGLLEVARERAAEAIRQKKVFFQHHNLRHLRFADSVIDLVFSNLGLYHVLSVEDLLVEVIRVLKPGCRAFFTLPLEGSFQELLSLATRFFQQYQELDIVEYIHYLSLPLRTPAQAESLLHSVGFGDVQLQLRPFPLVFQSSDELLNSPFIRYHFLDVWEPRLRHFTPQQVKSELKDMLELMYGHKAIELTVQAACLIGTKDLL